MVTGTFIRYERNRNVSEIPKIPVRDTHPEAVGNSPAFPLSVSREIAAGPMHGGTAEWCGGFGRWPDGGY